MCDFVCTNRKELKKHEAAHAPEDDQNLIAENLITSFPDMKIEVQGCEMMLDGGVIEVEHIQL